MFVRYKGDIGGANCIRIVQDGEAGFGSVDAAGFVGLDKIPKMAGELHGHLAVPGVGRGHGYNFSTNKFMTATVFRQIKKIKGR
jgi:hypothetical protein